MTVFRPSRDELVYHKKSFLENCRLGGRVVEVTNPITHTRVPYSTSDTYEYETSSYTQYIQLSEDLPKRQLELYGFFKEDATSKPLVAFIPVYRYANPELYIEDGGLRSIDKVEFMVYEGSKITLKNHKEYSSSITDDNTFMIEKIVSRDDSHFLVANLAPLRVHTEGIEVSKRPSSGSQFLRQSDE